MIYPSGLSKGQQFLEKFLESDELHFLKTKETEFSHSTLQLSFSVEFDELKSHFSEDKEDKCILLLIGYTNDSTITETLSSIFSESDFYSWEEKDAKRLIDHLFDHFQDER